MGNLNARLHTLKEEFIGGAMAEIERHLLNGLEPEGETLGYLVRAADKYGLDLHIQLVPTNGVAKAPRQKRRKVTKKVKAAAAKVARHARVRSRSKSARKLSHKRAKK